MEPEQSVVTLIHNGQRYPLSLAAWAALVDREVRRTLGEPPAAVRLAVNAAGVVEVLPSGVDLPLGWQAFDVTVTTE